MRNFLYLGVTICLGISSSYAVADQSIDIIGGNNASVPKVAIVNFANDMNGESAVAEVIKNDLNITGEFVATRYNDLSSVNNSSQYIITGSVSGNKISYQLSKPTWSIPAAKDTASGAITETVAAPSSSTASSPAVAPESATMLTQTVLFESPDLRKAEHTASNNIYQKITGTPGIFTSKIAFIVQDRVGVINKRSRRSPTYVYKLIVSDYDGYNQQTLATDSNPLSSISWNSDGTQIAYVAYESKPKIYIQNVYDSKKKEKGYLVSDFNGSNSSPAFINGNSQLVATLTIDDQSHLYTIRNAPFGKASTNTPIIGLQNFGTIDTEASVNGNKLVFTSNHDGGYAHPQIFLSTLSGDTPQDLTASLGSANTSAKFSHDGNKITFVSHNGGLKTYIMDLNTRSAFPVSIGTGIDLAPSFAPNDKLILFSSDNNQIHIVNTTGTTQTRLNKIQAGTIIDQEWANNF